MIMTVGNVLSLKEFKSGYFRMLQAFAEKSRASPLSCLVCRSDKTISRGTFLIVVCWEINIHVRQWHKLLIYPEFAISRHIIKFKRPFHLQKITTANSNDIELTQGR